MYKIVALCFLIALFIFKFSFLSSAHECILKGDSAKEINQYNLCLNNEINQSKNQTMQIDYLNRELNRLTAENNFLKEKINKIELLLYQILKEI
tara:strand:+ start:1656 stop:1937 length:282 start_codon:yes stop_codon:yes gene_type:complete